ncbi:hypothetical protein JCM11641_001673 [Rhodosporidiobolus odoratus]
MEKRRWLTRDSVWDWTEEHRVEPGYALETIFNALAPASSEHQTRIPRRHALNAFSGLVSATLYRYRGTVTALPSFPPTLCYLTLKIGKSSCTASSFETSPLASLPPTLREMICPFILFRPSLLLAFIRSHPDLSSFTLLTIQTAVKAMPKQRKFEWTQYVIDELKQLCDERGIRFIPKGKKVFMEFERDAVRW